MGFLLPSQLAMEFSAAIFRGITSLKSDFCFGSPFSGFLYNV
uniref:Uncharacterized protein n=1 Tax=Anguilla anguilla TaxID=7936 RepID=A0A0E9SY20_ANGAN